MRQRLPKVPMLVNGIFACLLIFSFYGCTTVSTYSEKDNSVSFGNYKTFAWLPIDQKDMRENIRLRNQTMVIHESVEKELEKRGLAPDTTAPDILLRFTLKTITRTEFVNQPVYTYPAGYGWWGRGHYWYGPGYVVYNRYPVKVRDGSLVIDVIERESGNVIWRGWSTEELNNSKAFSKNIPEMIKNIFDRYPVKPPQDKK